MIAEETADKDLMRRQKAQAMVNAYHRVFDTVDGKTVLADLNKRFRLNESAFFPVGKGTHSAYDPLAAALTDGARQVCIHIKETLSIPADGDANLKPKTKVKK
jgi:hypothetical protein